MHSLIQIMPSILKCTCVLSFFLLAIVSGRDWDSFEESYTRHEEDTNKHEDSMKETLAEDVSEDYN